MVIDYLLGECPLEFTNRELAEMFVDYKPADGSRLRGGLQEFVHRLTQQLHRRSSDLVSCSSLYDADSSQQGDIVYCSTCPAGLHPMQQWSAYT